MDHLQYDLIANDRHADLLAEAAERHQALQAEPASPLREIVAERLVAVALRIAPSDSPLRRQSSALHLAAQG